MGGLATGPPNPPDARKHPGKAVALLDNAGGLTAAAGVEVALEGLEPPGQRVTLGGEGLGLPVARDSPLLLLSELSLERGLAIVDVLDLRLQPRDPPLGRQVGGEEHVEQEQREQGASRDEQPRHSHAIHPDRDSSKSSNLLCSPAKRRSPGVELRRFFDRVIRASFHDLALDGDPAAPYLAD